MPRSLGGHTCCTPVTLTSPKEMLKALAVSALTNHSSTCWPDAFTPACMSIPHMCATRRHIHDTGVCCCCTLAAEHDLTDCMNKKSRHYFYMLAAQGLSFPRCLVAALHDLVQTSRPRTASSMRMDCCGMVHMSRQVLRIPLRQCRPEQSHSAALRRRQPQHSGSWGWTQQ